MQLMSFYFLTNESGGTGKEQAFFSPVHDLEWINSNKLSLVCIIFKAGQK